MAERAGALSGALSFVLDSELARAGDLPMPQPPSEPTGPVPAGSRRTDDEGESGTGSGDPGAGIETLAIAIPEDAELPIDGGESGSQSPGGSLRGRVLEWLHEDARRGKGHSTIVVFADMRSEGAEPSLAGLLADVGGASAEMPMDTEPHVVLVLVWPDRPGSLSDPSIAAGFVGRHPALLASVESVLQFELSETASGRGVVRLLSDDELETGAATIVMALALSDSLRHRLASYARERGGLHRVRVGYTGVYSGELSSSRIRDCAIALCDQFLGGRGARVSGFASGSGWADELDIEPQGVARTLMVAPPGTGVGAEAYDRLSRVEPPRWNNADAPAAGRIHRRSWPLSLLDTRRAAVLAHSGTLAARMRENGMHWREGLSGKLAAVVDREVEQATIDLDDAVFALEELNNNIERLDVTRYLQRGDTAGFDTALAELRDILASEPHRHALTARYLMLAVSAVVPLSALVQHFLPNPSEWFFAPLAFVLAGVGWVAARAHHARVLRSQIGARDRVVSELGSWLIGDLERLAAQEARRGAERLRRDLETVHIPAVNAFRLVHARVQEALGRIMLGASGLFGYVSAYDLLGLPAQSGPAPSVAQHAASFLKDAGFRSGWRSLDAPALGRRIVRHARTAAGLGEGTAIETMLLGDSRVPAREVAESVERELSRPQEMLRHSSRASHENARRVLICNQPESSLWEDVACTDPALTWDEDQALALMLALEWGED